MKTRITLLFAFVALTNTAWADLTSVGIDGINATATGLDGTDAVIGMVENGRPGDPDKDLPINYHEQVNPTQVYQGSSIDGANSGFVAGGAGLHATEVAGVMIASNTPNGGLRGVAPKALLHAGANPQTPPDVDFAVTGDRIARIPNMRAINVSAGRAFMGLEGPNGDAFPSQFIDWSSENQDVLWVIAASEDNAMVGTPQDSFNGITVGASQTLNAGVAGSFRQAWSGNDTSSDPNGARTAIDILAPGFDIFVTGQNNQNAIASGTSYAAPHVTGTVALLQQFAETQANPPISNPGFTSLNHREPEVMKAILLNSADKLSGIHGSMRDIVRIGGSNWTTTLANNSSLVPLDEDMGAGHLNANSALINLRLGEQSPGMVPRIGWDFDEIFAGGSLDYTFDRQVSGYVAVTLAWNRIVDKTGSSTQYNVGDQFINQSIDLELNDLNLYLMDVNENNINNAIASSTATEDSVEHIFSDVPIGNYKIRVQHTNVLGDDQDFGLAWWAGEITPGDFDDDGDVDPDDLGQWQNNYGEDAGSLADADYDGDSDGSDFFAWQRNFGSGVPVVASSQAVPEPSSWLLCLMASATLMSHRQRKR